MTRSTEELIADHPFLSGLPAETAAAMASCARPMTFETGSLLLSEGAPADTLYLIVEGKVAIEIFAPVRGRVVLDTAGPGHVVGLSWVAPPFRWHFDARALEPVAAVALDSACLREQFREHPAVGYALLERLSALLLHRLQATRVRLLDLYGKDDGGRH